MQTQQISIAFSGSIPKFYDSFLGPMFFEPFALELAGRINNIQPNSLLELASGTGRLTKLLPSVLPAEALIIASDINPAMVEYGQKTVSDKRIDWKQIDAVTLPFEDDSFDCIAVQFGVMFYSDRIKAYKEALRVLKPGGTIIFTSWDEIKYNPVAKITNEVLSDFFPENTPAFYSVPFSYFNRKTIENDLIQSGFENVQIDTVNLSGYSKSAADSAKGLIKGTPTITAIEERNSGLVEPLLAELGRRLSDRFGESSFHVPLQAHIVTGTKK